MGAIWCHKPSQKSKHGTSYGTFTALVLWQNGELWVASGSGVPAGCRGTKASEELVDPWGDHSTNVGPGHKPTKKNADPSKC